MYRPDILVITGHDGIVQDGEDLFKVDNYFNSSFFIEAVLQARRYEPNTNKLVIFAGACQSNFEAIIAAGANYASSPGRTRIHILDPVLLLRSQPSSKMEILCL